MKHSTDRHIAFLFLGMVRCKRSASHLGPGLSHGHHGGHEKRLVSHLGTEDHPFFSCHSCQEERTYIDQPIETKRNETQENVARNLPILPRVASLSKACHEVGSYSDARGSKRVAGSHRKPSRKTSTNPSNPSSFARSRASCFVRSFVRETRARGPIHVPIRFRSNPDVFPFRSGKAFPFESDTRTGRVDRMVGSHKKKKKRNHRRGEHRSLHRSSSSRALSLTLHAVLFVLQDDGGKGGEDTLVHERKKYAFRS